jgi:hypothetical protein
MTTVTIQTPLLVRAPRGAQWAAQLFSRLMNLMERGATARVQRQERAARIAEASAVRQYAQRFAGHDPRFAADLMAAADRHELAE